MQEVLLPIVSLGVDANELASEFAYNQSCTTELVRRMAQAVGVPERLLLVISAARTPPLERRQA